MEKPRIRELIPAHFTIEEFQKLLQVIEDQNFKELCICAVMTGLRQVELLSMEWSSVDLELKLIFVKNSERFTTKTKKNRVVPISDQLCQLMANRKEAASSDLVFNCRMMRIRRERISHTFKKYVLKAGLRNELHFHSLRHTFATWLVEGSVSLYEIQKLLGHSTIQVTQIYSHLQPESLHRTVNKIVLNLN